MAWKLPYVDVDFIHCNLSPFNGACWRALMPTGVDLSKILRGHWANIRGEKVVKSDKCMGDSQLLGARARAPPTVYAYVYASFWSSPVWPYTTDCRDHQSITEAQSLNFPAMMIITICRLVDINTVFASSQELFWVFGGHCSSLEFWQLTTVKVYSRFLPMSVI